MSWIIQTDNFDRSGEQPGFDEKYVVHMYSGQKAAQVVRILNADKVNSNIWFKTEPDDYELKVFRP